MNEDNSKRYPKCTRRRMAQMNKKINEDKIKVALAKISEGEKWPETLEGLTGEVLAVLNRQTKEIKEKINISKKNKRLFRTRVKNHLERGDLSQEFKDKYCNKDHKNPQNNNMSDDNAEVSDAGKRQNGESEDGMPKRKREKMEHFWSRPVTMKLIELVKENYTKLTDKRCKRQTWLEIYETLKPLGSNLTLRKVEKKWRYLRQCYNHTLEQVRKLGSYKVKRNDYFEFLDEIFSVEPSVQSSLAFDQCILPVSSNQESVAQVHYSGDNIYANKTFRIHRLNKSPIKKEISEGPTSPRAEKPKHPYKGIEFARKELIEDNRKAISNKRKKVEVMKKDSEQRNSFNDGVLEAINRRTEIMDRSLSSTLKIEKYILMTQRYNDKLDKLENRIIRLENGMSRLESKFEKYFNNL